MILNNLPEPELGSKKKVYKFAWLPIRISPTQRVWLEPYVQHYEYRLVMNYGLSDYGWVESDRDLVLTF